MINQLMILIQSMLEEISVTDSNPIFEIMLSILFGLIYLVSGGVLLLVALIIRIVLTLLGWDPVPVPWI